MAKTKIDLELGKLPPQNIEAEEFVIGAILVQPQTLDLSLDIFAPDIFYKDQSKTIAEAIIELKNNNINIDLISVSQKLKQIGKLDIIGGAYYLVQLTQKIGHVTDQILREKIQAVFEVALKRNLITVSSNLLQKSYSDETDVFEVIDEFEQEVNKAAKLIVVEKAATFEDSFKEMMVRTAQISKITGAISGISTGFQNIDLHTGGWQKSDLIILAARPGMGKTSLALSLARNAAVLNKPTAIFSLEMASNQLVARITAAEVNIPLANYLRNGLKDYERDQTLDLIKKIQKAPIYIDDNGSLKIFNFRQKARKMKRDLGIELIIIDYLQLMSEGRDFKGNKNDEIGYITSNLKQIAKELDIPIIVLSQLSRTVETRSEKIPQLSDLRDSGNIEQDADMVIFLYRPEYYNILHDAEGNSTEGKALFMIAKHRNGSTIDLPIGWNGIYTKFFDIEEAHKQPIETKSNPLPVNNSFNNVGPDDF
jgi:replicative DNA helicase